MAFVRLFKFTFLYLTLKTHLIMSKATSGLSPKSPRATNSAPDARLNNMGASRTQEPGTTLGEPVRLRSKKLSGGRLSLYLDIYWAGKRSYHFLKLYLLPETDAETRTYNAMMLKTAYMLKAQKLLALMAEGMPPEPGVSSAAGARSTGKRTRKPLKLGEWMTAYRQQQERKGRVGTWQIAHTADLLVRYKGADVTLTAVDKAFCLGFADFLLHGYRTRCDKGIGRVTAANYFGRLNSALNAAVRAGLLAENPMTKLDECERIRATARRRNYLTIDEVKRLIDTDCPHPGVKRAFLFSCFCGLRLGDIYGLKWRDFVEEQGRCASIWSCAKPKSRYICRSPNRRTDGCPMAETPSLWRAWHRRAWHRQTSHRRAWREKRPRQLLTLTPSFSNCRVAYISMSY